MKSTILNLLIGVVVVCFILTIVSVFAAPPPTRNGCSAPSKWDLSQKVPDYRQPQFPWCSIASAQMTYGYYGKKGSEFDQCQLMTKALLNIPNTTAVPAGQSCCPATLTPSYPPTCENMGPWYVWPENIFSLPSPYSMHWLEVFPDPDQPISGSNPTALPWEDLKDQLFCKNRPFIFVWSFPNGKPDHALVAVGYEEMPDGQKLVYAHDPAPDPYGGYRVLIYENEFVENADVPGGGHFEDYVELIPRRDG